MDIGKDQQKEGEKQFSIQPIDDNANKPKDSKFDAFSSNPGPARTNDMPAHEGSREDRDAKKKELNK